MPVEVRPLFRPDVVARRVQTFALPERVEEVRSQLQNWAALVRGSGLAALREQNLLPDFLTDVFGRLLGYTGPASGQPRYTLSREKHVEVEGEFADAVLGEFGTARDRPVVAVEGKGPKNPLDRPFGGRRLSAVEQGYRYATNLPCDWIVVTNIREIRLYHKGSDQRTYERFDTARLGTDDEQLRRFVFLLGAERVVPETGPPHLAELLTASEQAGLELTRQFYAVYAQTRFDLLNRLREENPEDPPEKLLAAAQKLLDRVLFCAFAEDRGLLPAQTLEHAYAARNPFNPQPVWENFRGLFRSVDKGNPALDIPAYNGGLFEPDDFLDRLSVPDSICFELKQLGDYDYRPPELAAAGAAESEPLVDVDILGHIFEQSITDLEQIRSDLAAGDPELAQARKEISRRKREGAFYTPPEITRYIVRETLEPIITDRFESLRARHQEAATGTAPAVLEDPWIYDLEGLNEPQRKALVRFWEACLDELKTVRLLDLACGSGAFLIEAFDQFHRRYQEINERLTELRHGRTSLFDADRTILQNNLYGVDLNGEAVQIARLSVWIKTAERGKELTDLDHTIRTGNSLIEDSAVDPQALDWRSAFPEVFADGGFDAVVGNPPYVRQELLGPVKPYLEGHYRTYHGVADLYVYFFERGLDLLRPGGRLSFVVTNKWMKAGYGAPLRRLLAERTQVESVIDFGHARQIFKEADVFPSIVVVRKIDDERQAEPEPAQVSVIPRERLRLPDLHDQVAEEGFEVPPEQLAEGGWELEPPGVQALMKKIRERGMALEDYAGIKPYRGLLTGFNRAFLLDSATRERLVAGDPKSAEVIKPYLRGQDVRRWAPSSSGLWIVLLKSSADHEWPWSQAVDPERAFQQHFPSLYHHVEKHRDRLEKRTDQGRHWWELRPCAYYDVFGRPRIIYQEIQFHSSFAFERGEVFGNNKTFHLPVEDSYLLAILNSPLMWWYNWRHLPHMKDEALNPAAFKMTFVPIATPRDILREELEDLARRLVELQRERLSRAGELVDWLRVEYELETPGQVLSAPFNLASDNEWVQAVRRRGKKKLSAAALRGLRDEYAASIHPMRQRLEQAEKWEQRLSDLVNAAYGLTDEEVELMWRTAPPRMPVSPPRSAAGPPRRG